jgi:hypothetical protein
MELKCLRCGYTWHSKTDEKPKTCASKSCKSVYWQKPLTPYWRKVRETNKAKRGTK